MVQIEQLAKAVLNGDGLEVRSLAQDFFRENLTLGEIPKPEVKDFAILAVSASLLELFAERLKQEAPSWTTSIGPVAEPMFLVKSTATMRRLRTLCEIESPEPLRERGFYAPPNYLEFA